MKMAFYVEALEEALIDLPPVGRPSF